MAIYVKLPIWRKERLLDISFTFPWIWLCDAHIVVCLSWLCCHENEAAISSPCYINHTRVWMLTSLEIILVFAFGLIAQVFSSLTFIIYLQVLEAVGPIVFLSTDTRKLRNEGFLSPYHPRYPDILTNSAHPMVHTVLLKDLDIWVNAKLKFSLKF
jgi:hypothetical protein